MTSQSSITNDWDRSEDAEVKSNRAFLDVDAEFILQNLYTVI
ncbi:MAG: hypothetical protein ACI945_001229 [Pseudohongiellaceae bacterium]